MGAILASRFRGFQPRVPLRHRLDGWRLRRIRDTCKLAKGKLIKVIPRVEAKGEAKGDG
jgi:hypothetical protein